MLSDSQDESGILRRQNHTYLLLVLSTLQNVTVNLTGGASVSTGTSGLPNARGTSVAGLPLPIARSRLIVFTLY